VLLDALINSHGGFIFFVNRNIFITHAYFSGIILKHLETRVNVTLSEYF